jgi:hypothetical protein
MGMHDLCGSFQFHKSGILSPENDARKDFESIKHLARNLKRYLLQCKMKFFP